MDVLILGMTVGVLVALAIRLPLPDLPPDGVYALTAGVMTFFSIGTLAQFGGRLPFWLAGLAWVPAQVVRVVRLTRRPGGVGWNPFKPLGAGGTSRSSD